MRRRARATAAGLALALALAAWAATPARAALSARRGVNFLVVEDDGTVAGTDWNSASAVDATVRKLASSYLDFVPDEAQLIVIMTTFKAADAWWYLGMKNHVGGIGWKNEPDGQDYDYMPQTKIEGFVYLGEIGYWASLPLSEYSFTTMQELGHRWCCYFRFDQGSGPQTDLLGRADNHWSYFLDTGGSPMEGNLWHANGDGSFTTASAGAPVVYDDLALYAMGLLAPGAVRPLTLLDMPDTSGLIDEFGAPLGRASPPQRAGAAITLRATARTVSLADVLRAEGPREPPFPTQSIWRVGVVLVTRAGEDVTAEAPVAAALTDRMISDFATATRGRGQLVNLTDYRAASDAGADGGMAGSGTGCGCQAAGRGDAAPGLAGLALLSLLAIRSRRPLPR